MPLGRVREVSNHASRETRRIREATGVGGPKIFAMLWHIVRHFLGLSDNNLTFSYFHFHFVIFL